jgi:hypothetical protein
MLLATVEPFPHRRVVRRVAAHNPTAVMYSIFYIIGVVVDGAAHEGDPPLPGEVLDASDQVVDASPA